LRFEFKPGWDVPGRVRGTITRNDPQLPIVTWILVERGCCRETPGRLARDGAIVVDAAASRDERAAVDRWLAEDPGLAQEIRLSEKGCIILRRQA
jgi:hypothetical protein